MILQLPCPGCGLVLGVDASLAGRTVVCSRCRATVAVPAPRPGGLPAPYPYPYPYPYAGPNGAAFQGPASEAGAGLRIAGGVIGIVSSLIFFATAVGAIDVFEPRFGPTVAGLLALLAFAVAVWGVVIASLACTLRRWARVVTAWTQVAMVLATAPSFAWNLLGPGPPSELQDMLRVIFPVTVILAGAAATFSWRSAPRVLVP